MSNYRPQRVNANKHTERGTAALEKSVTADGWIGAQTAAADGEIFDGSAREELAADKFSEAEPITVHTDGSRRVVVVRDDIPSADDPRAKRLGVAANVIAHMDYAPDGEILAMIAQDDDAVAKLIKQDEASEDAVKAALADGLLGGDVDAEPQIDRAEELRVKWGVEAGQLWQLGEHRLICGDCTDRAVVARVMQGDKCDMVFTDTPYGVNYEYSEHKDEPSKYIALMDGFLSASPSHDLMILTCGVNGDLKYGKYWFGRNPDGLIVWFDKTKQTPSRVAYLCKSELVLIFGKLYERFAWDTLEVQQPRNDGLRELHTCPKPLELWEKIISTQKGANIIYDPFSGSGTTLIACERLGRKCRAVEISPAYVAVALQRYQDATGKTPILLESGNDGTPAR